MTERKYKKFYEHLGQVYPEEKYVHSSGWGRARKRFVSVLLHRYAKDGLWLDVGCGAGIFLRMFPNIGAKKSIGIDISHPVLMRAKLNRAEINAICADAEAIPLKNSSINLILSSENIEHLEHPHRFFSEASRILSRYGVIILTCPNWHGTKPVCVPAGILRHFGMPNESFIHTAFNPDELSALARAAGLSPIESGSFEYEMRIWGRIHDGAWNIIIHIMERLHIPAITIRFAYRLQSYGSGIIFQFLRITGLAWLMRRIFNRGPRSYIVAAKSEDFYN